MYKTHDYRFTEFVKQSLVVLQIFVFTAFSHLLSAQSADSLFISGRSLAFDKQYDTAIVLLNRACTAQPRNMDMRLMLARTYAWNKDYKNAEKNALLVIEKQPQNKDALAALADVYLWSNDWKKLEDLTFKALTPAVNSIKALESMPPSTEDSVIFIKKYALGLFEQARFEDGAKIIQPFKKQLPDLWRIFYLKRSKNTLTLYSSYYDFKTQQTDWQTGSIEYLRKMRSLSLVATMNYANRFGKQGTQWLFQAYPKIGRHAYAQLLFAYSEGKVFPNRTLGGSFFLNFKKYWEAELGIRQFQVLLNNLGTTENSNVLRGGLSFQKRSNRFSYTISKINGASIGGYAHNFSYRYYMKDTESYLQAMIGTGANTNSQLSAQFDNFIINSRVISVMTSRWLNTKWRIMGAVTGEQNENKTDNSWQSRITYDIGLGFRF